MFYLELVTDLLHLFVYFVFFLIIFAYYGLPVHLVRDLYLTFRNFRRRVGSSCATAKSPPTSTSASRTAPERSSRRGTTCASSAGTRWRAAPRGGRAPKNYRAATASTSGACARGSRGNRRARRAEPRWSPRRMRTPPTERTKPAAAETLTPRKTPPCGRPSGGSSSGKEAAAPRGRGERPPTPPPPPTRTRTRTQRRRRRGFRRRRRRRLTRRARAPFRRRRRPARRRPRNPPRRILRVPRPRILVTRPPRRIPDPPRRPGARWR